MPNNVIQKVYNGWNEYLVGGWTTEWQEVVYLTQAEYDALPASKLTDGKIYKVKTTGVVPGGSADASDVEYDNTTSGLTATDVQSAIDEVNSKVSYGTVFERWDMLLFAIDNVSPIHWAICLVSPDYDNIKIRNTVTWTIMYDSGSTSPSPNACYKNVISIDDTFYTLTRKNSGRRYEIHMFDTNWTETVTIAGEEVFSAHEVKNDWEYWYCSRESSYYKIDVQWNKTESTQSEFDAIPSGVYYKWLYYSQDNNDYVAVDSTGTEVKRYSNVGTINGIYDDKLYRNIGDLSYAIATI